MIESDTVSSVVGNKNCIGIASVYHIARGSLIKGCAIGCRAVGCQASSLRRSLEEDGSRGSGRSRNAKYKGAFHRKRKLKPKLLYQARPKFQEPRESLSLASANADPRPGNASRCWLARRQREPPPQANEPTGTPWAINPPGRSCRSRPGARIRRRPGPRRALPGSVGSAGCVGRAWSGRWRRRRAH